MRVRTSYPRTVTREELNSDPLVGGRVAGIQKSLQRLVKKGLVEERKGEGRYGKKEYRAVLARGEGGGECPPLTRIQSLERLRGWTTRVDKKSCPLSEQGWTAKNS